MSAGRLHLFEACPHLPVHQVDRLQWSDHHPELDDASLLVAADDVDAVDVLALDGGLELEHRRIIGQHGLRVVEALSLIHISEPTRRTPISYAVFCLKKKK